MEKLEKLLGHFAWKWPEVDAAYVCRVDFMDRECIIALSNIAIPPGVGTSFPFQGDSWPVFWHHQPGRFRAGDPEAAIRKAQSLPEVPVTPKQWLKAGSSQCRIPVGGYGIGKVRSGSRVLLYSGIIVTEGLPDDGIEGAVVRDEATDLAVGIVLAVVPNNSVLILPGQWSGRRGVDLR